MKVTVSDCGRQPQCRAEIGGSTDEEIGHVQAREGVSSRAE